MKFAVNYIRLVFALLNHQTPSNLATAAVMVPLTGLVLLWLITRLAGVLSVLLLAWGCLLLGMAVVKFAQQFLWRVTR